VSPLEVGLIPLGIGDFFLNLLSPLHAAVSGVLVGAYHLWSNVTGVDTGLTWALAIISLTIVVRTLLIPLFVKQINSARNMQLIQPKMKALQDKYGADRERLSIETQKLMKSEGVNPMASCFPMLLQMPIFFALYQVLYYTGIGQPRGYFLVRNPDLVESLRNAEFLGAQLAGHFWDSAVVFKPAQWGGTQWLGLVLIISMVITFFVTQKQIMTKNMSPEALTGPMAQQQKMMLYLFPLMYLFMGTIIQIGVLLYWVTSNLWTLVQQWLLIRNNPSPGTPAYIDWEERMIKKGRDPRDIEAERAAKRGHGKAVETTAPAANAEGGVQRQTVQRQQIQPRKKQTRAQRKDGKGGAGRPDNNNGGTNPSK
jgi:YidC/Oxa1 family membrane protein insertase